MCRVRVKVDSYRAVWVKLKCTTNADKLYARASKAAERLTGEIEQIEPCIYSLRSAVRSAQTDEIPF